MITIEKATLEDCPAIAMIHTTCWAEVYDFIPENVHESRSVSYRKNQWQDVVRRAEEGDCLFSVRNNGRVVGFGFSTKNKDKALPALGELHAAYILKPYRGGFAGLKLMKAMVTHLVDCRLEPISLWAFKQNRMSFTYRSLGWKPIVSRDREIAGELVPEVGYIHPDIDGLLDRLDAFGAKHADKLASRAI